MIIAEDSARSGVHTLIGIDLRSCTQLADFLHVIFDSGLSSFPMIPRLTCGGSEWELPEEVIFWTQFGQIIFK